MPLKLRVLGVALTCALAAPLAAQEATLTLDTPVSAGAGGQILQPPAGPPPTPEHTGIKATLKDLVTDVKHLPSMQNLF